MNLFNFYLKWICHFTFVDWTNSRFCLLHNEKRRREKQIGISVWQNNWSIVQKKWINDVIRDDRVFPQLPQSKINFNGKNKSHFFITIYTIHQTRCKFEIIIMFPGWLALTKSILNLNVTYEREKEKKIYTNNKNIVFIVSFFPAICLTSIFTCWHWL